MPVFSNLEEFNEKTYYGLDDFLTSLSHLKDENDRVEIMLLWLEKNKGAEVLKEEKNLEKLCEELPKLFDDKYYHRVLNGNAIGRHGIENNLNIEGLLNVNLKYDQQPQILATQINCAISFWLERINRAVSLDEISSALSAIDLTNYGINSLFQGWLRNPHNNVTFEEINFGDPIPEFATESFYEVFFRQERNGHLLNCDKNELKNLVAQARNRRVKLSAVKNWIRTTEHSFDFDFLEQEIFPQFEQTIDKLQLIGGWFKREKITAEAKCEKFIELLKLKPDFIHEGIDNPNDKNAMLAELFEDHKFPPQKIIEFCEALYPESEFERAQFFIQLLEITKLKHKEIVKDFIRSLENREIALNLLHHDWKDFEFERNDRLEMINSQRAYLLAEDVEISDIQRRGLIPIRVISDHLKFRILPIPPILDNIDEYQFGKSVVLDIDREAKLEKFKELMKKDEITDAEAVDFFEETLCLGKGAIDVTKIDPTGLNGHQRAGNLLRHNKSEIAFLLSQDDADLFIGLLGEIDGGCGANIGTHVQTNVDRKLTKNVFDQVLLSTFQEELALPILTKHGDKLGADPKGAVLFDNGNINSSFIRPEMLLRIVKERFYGNGKLKRNPWDVIRCGLDEDEVRVLSEQVLQGENYNSDAADIATLMVLQQTIPAVIIDKSFKDLYDRCEEFTLRVRDIVQKEQEEKKSAEETELMQLEDFDASTKISNRANTFKQQINSASAQNAEASRFVTTLAGRVSGNSRNSHS